MLSRFAARIPVIVVEEPYAAPVARDEIETTGNLTVVRPHRPAWSDTIDDAAIATVRTLVGGRRPLVWLYTPQMLPLADAFGGAPLVYDKMDELATFKDADSRVGEREPAVLQRSAVAFAGGRSLHASIATRTRVARAYPSGVDIVHFGRARGGEPHPDVRDLPHPIATYIGVIDERLDLPLIERLARERPQLTLAIVGPVAKIDPASLPPSPNIHYLGKRAYDELPAILAATDVALMPFALNEATRSISPTKTLEYLAAGVPVVSTAVPDVVADHHDIVRIAHDEATFIRLVDEALADRTPDPRVEERLRRSTWDAIAVAMWDDVERALGRRSEAVPSASVSGA